MATHHAIELPVSRSIDLLETLLHRHRGDNESVELLAECIASLRSPAVFENNKVDKPINSSSSQGTISWLVQEFTRQPSTSKRLLLGDRSDRTASDRSTASSQRSSSFSMKSTNRVASDTRKTISPASSSSFPGIVPSPLSISDPEIVDHEDSTAWKTNSPMEAPRRRSLAGPLTPRKPTVPRASRCMMPFTALVENASVHNILKTVSLRTWDYDMFLLTLDDQYDLVNQVFTELDITSTYDIGNEIFLSRSCSPSLILTIGTNNTSI